MDAIQTVAANSSNVTTVAGISANVTSVAGIASLTGDFVTDINLVATSDFISDINSLATSDFTDLNAIEAVKADVPVVIQPNVSAVATNIACKLFASVYRVGRKDPSSSLDEGDLFYNSTDNVLKYYNGQVWVMLKLVMM